MEYSHCYGLHQDSDDHTHRHNIMEDHHYDCFMDMPLAYSSDTYSSLQPAVRLDNNVYAELMSMASMSVRSRQYAVHTCTSLTRSGATESTSNGYTVVHGTNVTNQICKQKSKEETIDFAAAMTPAVCLTSTNQQSSYTTTTSDNNYICRVNRSKYKAAALCCAIAMVTVVSSAIVINAFFQWNTMKINEAQMHSGREEQTDSESFSQLDQTPNLSQLNVNVKIYNVTTLPTANPATGQATAVPPPNQFHNKWLKVTSSPHPPLRLDNENEMSDNDDEDDDDEWQGFSGWGHGLSKTSDNIIPYRSLADEKPAAPSEISPIEASISSDHTTSGSHDFTSHETRPAGDEAHVTMPSGLSNKPGSSSVSRGHGRGSWLRKPDADSCEMWMRCEDPFLQEYANRFSELPSCPCTYPLNGAAAVIADVYDEYQKRTTTWKRSMFSSSYMLAYHSGARVCVRSVAAEGFMAAQNCCYDSKLRLITRGSGAGTPSVMSPDISQQLHYLVDRMPWILCGGDWSKYNSVRPPNNVRSCPANPKEVEYMYQLYKLATTSR